MNAPITAPITAATTPSTASGTGTGASAGSSRLASQLSTPSIFIKLLMAQLEHQDPTNPTTPSTLLQQTAALSQVEAVTTMTTSLNDERRYAESSAATGLIGKVVTANVTGMAVTGSVSEVSLSKTGTPVLKVAGVTAPLSSILDVRSAVAQPGPTTTTPTTTTPTTTTTTTTTTPISTTTTTATTTTATPTTSTSAGSTTAA